MTIYSFYNGFIKKSRSNVYEPILGDSYMLYFVDSANHTFVSPNNGTQNYLQNDIPTPYYNMDFRKGGIQ